MLYIGIDETQILEANVVLPSSDRLLLSVVSFHSYMNEHLLFSNSWKGGLHKSIGQNTLLELQIMSLIIYLKYS